MQQFNATKLKNGLTVLTYKMPNLSTIAVSLLVKVGSRYEDISINGISHFLEHMAFKGTSKRTAKQIAEEFDIIGGRFNAYTSRENTVYYAKVLKEDISTAVSIISDIIQNSLFNEEDISKEKNVIAQEIAQTLDNPEEMAFEKLSEVAYSNQALGRSILGTNDNIGSFNKQNFLKFMDDYYFPENMFLSFAGGLEHEDTISLASSFFGNMDSKHKISIEDAKYIGGCSYVHKDLEQTNFIVAFESPSYMNLKDFYSSQVLSLILGGGISSRLFQEIRENRGLAYAVSSYTSSYYDTGLFGIYSATSHDKLEELCSITAIEVKKACSKITEEEVQRAKSQIRANIIMAEEKNAYKSEDIGRNYSIFGKFITPEEVLDYINSTSPIDLHNIAQKIFSSTPSISIVGPEMNLDYGRVQEQFKIK